MTQVTPETPLLAAGGVANGATLAAALLAGADGAWLGTAFLATNEAVEVGDDHEAAILEPTAATRSPPARTHRLRPAVARGDR